MTPTSRIERGVRARGAALGIVAVCLVALSASVVGAESKDAAAIDALSLHPTRTVAFTTDEGTWTSVTVSPDGSHVLFDLLGDIYSLDIGGGTAKPVLTGMPFETQPVFSPDGTKFAFLSDRSGAENLWVCDADGSHPRQLSRETNASIFASPAWSPDGRYVYVSRTTPSVAGFEMWSYALEGGTGLQLTKAKPTGSESYDQRANALGAAPSADGRFLYYAAKHGGRWTEHVDGEWSIVKRELATGQEEKVISTPGSAMRPVLSPDGRLLVYAVRHDQKTGLRARDLATSADRWLIDPIERDGQEGAYDIDLVPGYAFMPDGKSLVISIGGKLRRVTLAGGSLSTIPFTANVSLDVGPSLRVSQHDETGPVHARTIQTPAVSPDGKRIAFSALTRIYVMNVDGSGLAPLTPPGVAGFYPTWSPDGQRIAYVSWTATGGGFVWEVRAGRRSPPTRLTVSSAYYTDPVYSKDGQSVFAIRSSHYARLHQRNEIWPDRPAELIELRVQNGALVRSFPATGAKNLHLGPDPERIYYYAPDGLVSVRRDGSERRQLVKVEGRNMSQYAELPAPMDLMKASPDGKWALAKVASELYLVSIPPAGGPIPAIDLADPKVPCKKLTKVGADFFDWADGGKTIYWAVGSTLYHRSLTEVVKDEAGDTEARAAHVRVDVTVPRDIPKGSVVLRGGTAITMKGDEVIEHADVLVTDNRIAAIGREGTVAILPGAVIRDVSGKFLTPGFVDTHAHWFQIKRDVLDLAEWDFRMNLAYGVTSGLDVQAFTIDVFAYQDLLDAGMMTGMRAYSVGPGVFVNSNLDSKAAALAVLTRYRDHYGTRNIKSYMVGGRRERQYMVEAAKELGMMPTTEGASDLKLDLTHAIDGFAGNEHALPISTLYNDVFHLYTDTRIAYTPTFIVMYGGPPILDAMMIATPPHDDPKVQRFMPHFEIDASTRPRKWWPAADRTSPLFAADAARIQKGGGLIGIGSHGEFQGLGYHWEMQAYASGGLTPHEVLKAATINSSEIIGHAADIGSLEPGKYADILIMDSDPLTDIKNALSLRQVMKNGRLYDAASLDEIWPRQVPLSPFWFWDAGERAAPVNH